MFAPVPIGGTPESALEEARRLAEQGRYAEALQKHLWFHENALEQDGSYYGVRLSFALAQWVELGMQYPPALDALRRIRDRDTAQLLAGRIDRELMHDVASINDYLQEPEATVEAFKKIEASHPEFASQVYDLVDEALIDAAAYELARKYLGDPLERFATARRNYDNGMSYATRHPHSDSAEEITEIIFTDRALRLITVLDRTGDQELAREVQAEALKVVDGPRLRAVLEHPLIEPANPPNDGPATSVENSDVSGEGRHR